MRVEGSAASLSWIPQEAVRGATCLAFDAGFTHYDEPPPDRIDDIEALRQADRFRFANVLSAWMDADEDGQVVDCGYSGGGLMGATTVAIAGLHHLFEAVALPVIQAPPEVGPGCVKFVQTVVVGPGFPHREGCATSHSSSGRRLWSGRQCP